MKVNESRSSGRGRKDRKRGRGRRWHVTDGKLPNQRGALGRNAEESFKTSFFLFHAVNDVAGQKTRSEARVAACVRTRAPFPAAPLERFYSFLIKSRSFPRVLTARRGGGGGIEFPQSYLCVSLSFFLFTPLTGDLSTRTQRGEREGERESLAN